MLGLASGQPPWASRARTRATSASVGCSLVTLLIAPRMAWADSGSLAEASSSAICLTSASVSSLPSRANSGM